jgi:hypothetical protein
MAGDEARARAHELAKDVAHHLCRPSNGSAHIGAPGHAGKIRLS